MMRKTMAVLLVALVGLAVWGAAVSQAQAESDLIKRLREREREQQLNKPKPTGFMRREFTIRQINLGGRWGEAELLPNFGFNNGYKDISEEEYAKFLDKGLKQLKGTVFEFFLGQMDAVCKRGVKAGAKVTAALWDKEPAWTTLEEKAPPFTMTRELYFQCLCQGEKAE